MKVRFKSTVATAGEINANKVCYTKECLVKVAEQIKRLPFGVLYGTGDISDIKPGIKYAAFLPVDVEFDGSKLDVTIETLDGAPYGELAATALVSNGQEAMSIGMRGRIPRKGELIDDVQVVDEFECTAISLLPKKSKA